MNTERNQLISLLLGELEQGDALQFRTRLADDSALHAQHNSLARQIAAIRAVPDDDMPQAGVDRLLAAARNFHEEPEAVQLARVITLRTFFTVYLPRVAAAALFVALVGLAVAYMPEGPAPGVGTMEVAGVTRVVADGELVAAGFGERLRIKTAGAEVLVDGGGAVRLHSRGEFKAPNIELDRGRVVIDATRGAAQVQAGAQSLSLEKGSVVAIERDREHAEILPGGAVVDVQRTTIGRLLAQARDAYGLNLDGSSLPEEVIKQRVTFCGTQIDAAEFKRTFEDAAAKYGVRFSGQRLVYMPGTLHKVGATDQAEVLSLNVLQGGVAITGTHNMNLRRGGLSGVMIWSSGNVVKSESKPERACTWARGLGNTVVEARLGDVHTGDATLPLGTVIHPERLVLPEGQERIFVLDGPDFNFPLPGGQRGKLIGLMSSGAEFELEGTVTRVFVPHSRVTRD